MRRTVAVLSGIPLLLGLLLLAAALTRTRAAAQDVEGTRPACVQVQAQPRMQAFGWDHVVAIQNRCTQAVTCRVSTDVSPTPTSVSVPAGQSRDTLTWRGSPASVFRAHVDCEAAR